MHPDRMVERKGEGMKNRVWITGIALVALALFGAGFLAGRQFPTHRFQEIGASPYLYDASTGRVCRMFSPQVPLGDLFDSTASQDKNGNPDEQAPAWISELTGPSAHTLLCSGK